MDSFYDAFINFFDLLSSFGYLVNLSGFIYKVKLCLKMNQSLMGL